LQDSNVGLRGKIQFILHKVEDTGGGVIGPVDAQAADLKDKLGMAGFPLNSMISTAKVTMNNMTMTTSVSQHIQLYLNSLSDEVSSQVSPCFMPDNLSKFVEGSLDNLLRWKDDSIMALARSRGFAGNYKVTMTNKPAGTYAGYTKQTVLVEVELDELLAANPFQWKEGENAQPFYNLPKYSIELALHQDAFNRIVNLNDSDYSIAIPTTAGFSALDLRVAIKSYTPHLKMVIPSPLYYNSQTVQTWSTTVPGLNAGTPHNDNVQTNDLNITGAPSMFALCIRDRDADANPQLPYRTASIDSVRIRVNNHDGQLGEYTSRDLYEISRKNGYRQQFGSFCGQRRDPSDAGAGNCSNSWFFFKLSDLSTDEFTVSNSNVQLNMTVEVKYSNNTDANMPNLVSTLYTIRDNVVICDNGNFESVLPLLDAQQIADAKVEFVDDNEEVNNVLGGKKNFWRGLRRFGRKIGKALTSNTAKKIARTVRNLPGVKDLIPQSVHQVADMAGYGVVRSAGSASGGKPVRTAGKKKSPKGSGVVRSAGKKLTAAQMKKMLGL